MTIDDTRRVLRRCPACRLLFEAIEGTAACVVCNAPVDGLALPLNRQEAAPSERLDREETAPLPSRN
jgi:uncharacterized Zn finger protein (UPF0148 family)